MAILPFAFELPGRQRRRVGQVREEAHPKRFRFGARDGGGGEEQAAGEEGGE